MHGWAVARNRSALFQNMSGRSAHRAPDGAWAGKANLGGDINRGGEGFRCASLAQSLFGTDITGIGLARVIKKVVTKSARPGVAVVYSYGAQPIIETRDGSGDMVQQFIHPGAPGEYIDELVMIRRAGRMTWVNDASGGSTPVAAFEYLPPGRMISSELRFCGESDAMNQTLKYCYDGRAIITEYGETKGPLAPPHPPWPPDRPTHHRGWRD